MNVNLYSLANGIRVHTVDSDVFHTSCVRLIITKGYINDPLAYSGTYHFLEHMLGSYFGVYGHEKFFDGMYGLTSYDMLFIEKDFLYDSDEVVFLINNIVKFIKDKSFNPDVLYNERLMVHNEHMTKIDKFFMMKIYSVYEQVKYRRLHATAGNLKSISSEVVTKVKNSLAGKDYVLQLTNIPPADVKKFIGKFEAIKFTPEKLKYEKAVDNVIKGRYVVNLINHVVYYALFLENLDEDFCHFITYVNRFYKYKTFYFVISLYNRNTLFIEMMNIPNFKYKYSEIVNLFIESFLYFLNNISRYEIELYNINNIIYYSLFTNKKNSAKDIYKSFEHFVMNYKLPVFKFQDFVIFTTSSNEDDKTNFNIDSNLYFIVNEYDKKVEINYKDVNFKHYDEFRSLHIQIDNKQKKIFSNYFLEHQNNVYLKIQVFNKKGGLSSDDALYFLFFILNECINLYYTVYNNNTFIINCYDETTKNTLETNLKSVTYRDIALLINNINNKNILNYNTRNNLFFLINKYIKNVKNAKITEKAVIDDFRYELQIYEMSKYIIDIHGMKLPKVSDAKYFHLFNELYSSREHVIIKSLKNNIVVSLIYLQYVYSLLSYLMKKRRLYSHIIYASVGFEYYVIVVNAPIPDLRNIMIQQVNEFKDIFDDIDFYVDLSLLVNYIIKNMLFYKIDYYNITFDIHNISLVKQEVLRCIDESLVHF